MATPSGDRGTDALRRNDGRGGRSPIPTATAASGATCCAPRCASPGATATRAPASPTSSPRPACRRAPSMSTSHSKEDCFVELHRRTSAQMLRGAVETAEATVDLGPAGCLAAVIRSLVGYADRNPRLAEVLRAELGAITAGRSRPARGEHAPDDPLLRHARPASRHARSKQTSWSSTRRSSSAASPTSSERFAEIRTPSTTVSRRSRVSAAAPSRSPPQREPLVTPSSG